MANAKLEPGKPDVTLGKQTPAQPDHVPTDVQESGLEEHNPLAELGLKRPVQAKTRTNAPSTGR